MAPPNVRDQQLLRETVLTGAQAVDLEIIREAIIIPPNGAYDVQLFREAIIFPITEVDVTGSAMTASVHAPTVSIGGLFQPNVCICT